MIKVKKNEKLKISIIFQPFFTMSVTRYFISLMWGYVPCVIIILLHGCTDVRYFELKRKNIVTMTAVGFMMNIPIFQ